MDTADRRRLYSLGNRLWHTDASFQDPPGRYSMLHARVVPPVAADTEFADMRTAYETLPDETKARIEGLQVHHCIAYSRQTLGFEFSQTEADALKGAVHPLVRTNPATGRKSLYIASHASTIIDWPMPDARLFLMDLQRARHAAREHLPPLLARRRPRDLGQPRHDAPRHRLRGHEVQARAAPRHDAGPAARRAGDDDGYRRRAASTSTCSAPIPRTRTSGDWASSWPARATRCARTGR